MKNYKEIYQEWKNKADIDEELYQELLDMNEHQIEESFYKSVDFGTGGIRTKMGAGTNKLNIYTVRKCAQGYAQWLLKQDNYDASKCVLIAHDNRYNAGVFTSEIVAVLSKHAIRTAIFKSLRSTPELSYAIRKLNALGGIVITASHNTKEYNGIKIYDETGCQCTEDYTRAIKAEINTIENELLIKVATLEEREKYNITISDEIDNSYIEESLTIAQTGEYCDYSKLNVIYTPQHGTGLTVVPKALEILGVNVKLVENQSYADPNFTNTVTPNPEKTASFEEALKMTKDFKADIVMGTDPDCDRIGVIVLHDGEYVHLTGNQLGVIMLDFILSSAKEGYVYSTVVTTPLVEKICSTNDVKHIQTLTGFKNIGAQMNLYENDFMIAIEESNGYLIKDIVRDKDGLQSVLYTMKIASYYKEKGLDLITVLHNIYDVYGYIQEKQESISLDGEVNNNKVDMIMNTLRQYKEELGNFKIYKVEDFKSSICYCNGKEERIDLPKSNVLKIYFSEFSWVAIRPSGTEPKIKIYYCIETKTNDKTELNEVIKTMKTIIQ